MEVVASDLLGVVVDVELVLLRVGSHLWQQVGHLLLAAEVAIDDLKCFLVNVLVFMVLQEFDFV